MRRCRAFAAIIIPLVAAILFLPFTSTANTATANAIGYRSNVVPPAIQGVAQVGKVLAANFGTWDPAPKLVKVQWFADGALLADHGVRTVYPSDHFNAKFLNSAQLVVPEAAVGKAITFVVSDAYDFSTPATSSQPTSPVVPSWWRPVNLPAGMTAETLACASQTACFALAHPAAGSQQGARSISLLQLKGATWQTVRSLGKREVADLDCSPDGFCMAYAGSYGGRHNNKSRYKYTTYSNGIWTLVQPMPKIPTERTRGVRWKGYYLDLNCASRRFCAVTMGGSNDQSKPGVGGGSGGWMVTWTPQNRRVRPPAQPWMAPLSKKRLPKRSPWSSPIRATGSSHLYGFDCTGPTFCMVHDSQNARLSTFDPSNPKGKVVVGPKMNVYGESLSLSCDSSIHCVASNSSYALVWDGAVWGKKHQVPTFGNGEDSFISTNCRAGATCVGLAKSIVPGPGGGTSYGVVYRLDDSVGWVDATIPNLDPRGVAQVGIDELAFDAEFIECPTTTFCVATTGDTTFTYQPAN